MIIGPKQNLKVTEHILKRKSKELIASFKLSKFCDDKTRNIDFTRVGEVGEQPRSQGVLIHS